MWGVLSLCMQLIKTTNRCHVSLSMLGESAQTRGLLWQWGLCVIPGCQPVCPRVLFLSNLHLTFRLTALLSHFSWLISFEEIIFELQHRLTVSDDTTDTTHRYEFWQNASHDATATGVCWRRLCLINCAYIMESSPEWFLTVRACTHTK